jgi:hypothetical protein
MFKRASILLLTAQVAACATLFAGTPQVPVMTNPPGAGVYVNGALVAQTPTVLPLEASRPAHIQIYMPGYRPVQIIQHKSTSGWFWLNLLVWPGFLVDLATGKYQTYEDAPIAIGLVPEAGPEQPPQQHQDHYPPPPPPGPAPVQPGLPR